MPSKCENDLQGPHGDKSVLNLTLVFQSSAARRSQYDARSQAQRLTAGVAAEVEDSPILIATLSFCVTASRSFVRGAHRKRCGQSDLSMLFAVKVSGERNTSLFERQMKI